MEKPFRQQYVKHPQSALECLKHSSERPEVRSRRLLVGRLFALASVGGLAFSVAGLWNSDCVALGARKALRIAAPFVRCQ